MGLAGAALQGLLRNPLADPGVIGVSSSAGLGAVLVIYFGVAAEWELAVPIAAMSGAALAVALLLALAGRDAGPLTLILGRRGRECLRWSAYLAGTQSRPQSLRSD